ncbi:MAG: tRNA nucleotidyltransferase, partial [Robiginitalea sp.]
MESKRYEKALTDPIFKVISKAANELELEAYVVGGYVRDYFLDRGGKQDIDVVAIGSGIALAEKVSQLLPGTPKVTVFKNFGTAMIRQGDLHLEFVGARK